jgi:hypothetical protein
MRLLSAAAEMNWPVLSVKAGEWGMVSSEWVLKKQPNLYKEALRIFGGLLFF